MNKNRNTYYGFSLTELLVTISVAAILIAIAIPAVKELTKTLENANGVRPLINAALSNAKGIASRYGHYAGVRFQQDKDGRQYMIFIIHDPTLTGGIPPNNFSYGFRVVDGRKPIALPEDIGVLQGGITYSDTFFTTVNMNNATTFSVVFNSAGKFCIFKVRARNIDSITTDASSDRVFNTVSNINKTPPVGMFIQDDYAANGYGEESSIQSLIIYSKKELERYPSNPWTGYLSKLEMVYVNPYSGELIQKQQ